ncbi:hypothetical protein O7623_12795 [Solwaraspora sp. WMMD791]|uniref:hypothetical protein n=1 Tax=Solwaraspora sp. WMMD791 TaxID=3016086 RepID=UPI00249C19CF|nr:hypothetical protein [Solwaraspora sp. WMMD791]WFE30005.1 hypothetical protein O7623_12795 [Solwaraspora sp. WMMD791]
MSRRSLVTVSAVVVVVLALAVTVTLVVLDRDGPPLTASDPDAGISVRVDGSAVAGRGASLRVGVADDPPAFPSQGMITPLGDVARVELDGGELTGAATITFDYPPDAPVDDMFIATYVADWEQWLPLGGDIDADAGTISTQTRHFSYWVVAAWDQEETAAQAALVLQREINANRYARGVAGILSVPPPLECRYQALPVRVDLGAFIPGMDTCARFHPDRDGTYQFSVGNTVGYPLLLEFPPALTVESAPDSDTGPTGRDNIYTALVEDVRTLMGDTAVVLSSGTRVTFRLDPAKLPESGTVTLSARLDYGHVLLDASGLLLQLLLPLSPDSRALQLWRQSEKYLQAAECILTESIKLGRIVGNPNGADLTGWVLSAANAYYEGVLRCAEPFVDFVLKFMEKPAETYVEGIFNGISNSLSGLLKRRFDAVLAVWRNSGAIRELLSGTVELARQAFTGDSGRRSVRLTVTDPPLDRLAEVVPRPGDGNFVTGTGPTDFVVTQESQFAPFGPFRGCPGDPEWQLGWSSTPHGTGYLYLGGASDLISAQVQVSHVPAGQRAAVEEYLRQLGSVQCRAERTAAAYTDYGPVVTARDYPAVTLVWNALEQTPDYQAAGSIWWGFDPRTGYLLKLQTQPFDNPEMSIGEVTEHSETAWYYLVKRAEAMLGTGLAPAS